MYTCTYCFSRCDYVSVTCIIAFIPHYRLTLHASYSQTFNTGMDALLAQQGEWRVASAGLRDRLSSMMTSRIGEVYASFFASYSIVKFSKKHMDEYLKYPPTVAERHLANFFGRA